MISKSFFKSSIIYTLGGAMPMVGGFILLPFYANRLSELHYAQVQFYILVTLLLQILFSYSIESYFGIKYTQLSREPEQQKKFTGTVSILLLIIGVSLLIAFSLTGNFIFSKVFRSDFQMEFWPYGFYAVLTAFFNSYFKASTNALIYFKKPALFFIANIINFIATIGISVGGLILYPETIIGPMYGRLLSGIIIFLIGQYIFSSYGKFQYESAFLKDLTAFCTPYIFFALSTWVLSQIDRLFLQESITKGDLNTYDLALKCFFGIEFLQNSLSAIIFPKLYEIWAKQDKLHTTKESNRYFNVFTAINILQIIIFCIALPLAYKLLIHNEKFYESGKYIGVIASGFALRSIVNFYLSTILFTKKPEILLKIFGISALCQIGLTYFLIRQFGLLGAIYAGLATKIIQVVLSSLFTKGIFVYEFNYFKIIIIPFIYIAINVLQFHFLKEYNVFFYIGQLLLFTFVFYYTFKNEIFVVIKQFIRNPQKSVS
jgi:O-antigen/teichoic acid export membrane protein